jgi:hypothetical protein
MNHHIARGSQCFASSLDHHSQQLTTVELTFVAKKIEHWIRFGHPVEDVLIDRRRRILSFTPGSIFALVHWAYSDFGAIVSRLDIIRAHAYGESCQTIPFVRPGGGILLRVNGWPKVQRALQAIDAIEALGIDPAHAAPDHWHHVNSRLIANQQPRTYTRSQHDTWLFRREVQS